MNKKDILYVVIRSVLKTLAGYVCTIAAVWITDKIVRIVNRKKMRGSV